MITGFEKIVEERIKKAIKNKDRIIIGGDFNGVTEISQRTGTIIDQRKQDAALINFLQQGNLVDLPTAMNCNEHTYIGKASTAMLDRFVASKNIIYSNIKQ